MNSTTPRSGGTDKDLSTAPAVIQAEFNITYQYPVRFTRHVFTPDNHCLRDALRGQAPVNTLVVIDEGCYRATPDLLLQIQQYFQHHRATIRLAGEPQVISGGENAKHQRWVDRLHQAMLTAGLDRHAYVITIGGGAVLDAAGYAAATFHRGVKTIRIPTTVLAQNDAGVGVKNGINAHHTKNLLGSFYPPQAVINDSAWLDTLPARDRRAGMAEAVKVAAIKDRLFFNWLEEHAAALARFEPTPTNYMIYRCAELHLAQITSGGDPFEQGNARPLDYGHWSAHKLESLSGYQLRHGEAVAIGMALDACYACHTKLLPGSEYRRLTTLLQRLGFTLWHPTLNDTDRDGRNKLLHGLEEFRQHLGGQLSITLLNSMGCSLEVNHIDHVIMQNCIQQLESDVAAHAV